MVVFFILLTRQQGKNFEFVDTMKVGHDTKLRALYFLMQNSLKQTSQFSAMYLFDFYRYPPIE